jgi:hypothetical protein
MPNTKCIVLNFMQDIQRNVVRHRPIHGRIKGFVGPRHFSSLGPFGDSTSIVGNRAYSRLSGSMEGEGMHGYLRNTNNPYFILYTPIAPLASHILRNVHFSHTSHFTGRLIEEFFFLKKNVLLKSCILFCITFPYFSFLYFYFFSLPFLRRP